MISLIRAAWQEELRVPMFVGLSTDGYPLSDDPAMKNGARIYHMDTGKEWEYSVDDDQWYQVAMDYARRADIEAIKDYVDEQLDEIRAIGSSWLLGLSGDMEKKVSKEAQAEKTAEMTEAVGIDENGKLWFKPNS